MKHVSSHQNGYVALITVVTIGALLAIVGMAATYTSINTLQTTLADEKASQALYLADGCIEESLLQLNDTGTIPASISFPEGTCNVTINSHSDTNWDFTVTVTVDGFTKRIQTTATRTTNVTLDSWVESE